MKMRRSLALNLCLFAVAAARLAVAAAPVLTASPSAVDFQYSAGEPQPAPVNVTVTASDGSTPVLSVSVTPAANTPATLFPVPPVEGDMIPVGFDPNTLNTLLANPGIYTATLTINAAGFASLAVPLTFSVGGTLSILPSPASLTFNVPGTATQTVQLTGNGGTEISFSLATGTSSGGNWLSATYSGAYTPATLTVTANSANLAAGTYQGSITVTPTSGASLGPVLIPVTMQIGTNTLGTGANSLTFAYNVGGTTPPSQTLQLTSTLSKDTFTAQAFSTGNWLLANGVTTVVSGALPASLNITVNPTGLSPGTYLGTISVTDGDGSKDVVTATLIVSGISIVANPTSLTFAAQVGEAAPPAQTVAVNGAANASYTVTVNGSFISVSSMGGPAPAQLTVSVNPTGLAAGSYSGTVVIDLDTHVQSITVALTVSANAVLIPNTGGYVFSYFSGSAPPSPVTLNVGVSSGGAQTFSFAPGMPSWLQISGGSNLTTPAALTVSVFPQTLPTGTYLADIILTPTAAGGVPVVVPVLVLVTGATAVVPNVTSLSFSGTAGGTALNQTVEVSASSATAFTASTSTVDGANWLSVSPTSGTANIGNLPLTVTANPANLAAGNYQGTVTLTTTAGVQSQISVAFTVATSAVPFTVTPSTLAFTYTLGGTLPAAQNLQVSGAQSFSVSEVTGSGGAWLSVTPTSGTGNAVLTASVNPAGLAAGTYSGTISVTPTGAAAQTVAVTLTVAQVSTLAASPNPLAFAYVVPNPNPAAQSLTVTSSGQAVNFTATASSSGWLSVTPASGTTPATLSVSVNPTNLGAGNYTGSIALSGTGGTLQLTVNVTLMVTAPLPSINHIANSASYLTGAIAPGEIVTIFGAALGPVVGVGATIDSKGYIETRLANVQVTFNNYPAPILYASAGQINAIVPYEVAGASNVSVESVFGSARSNSLNVQVVQSAPGIFSANATGQGGGAILDVNYHLVSASNPVSAGSVIQVFATGQGQTSPAGVDGLIEPSSLPLPGLLLAAGATIDGLPANIQYIGAAPGLVAGALQVNIYVPAGVTSGAAPLFLSIGGNSSQTGITVAIQ